MSRGRIPVVHVITRLELGGAQQNTLHTVAQLDRERFEPWLIAGEGGLLDDEARALPDVTVHLLPELVRPVSPLKDMAATRSVQALLAPLAAAGPLLVHTHSSKAGVIGRSAAARLGIHPVVHTIHGFGFAALGGAFKQRVGLFLERRMARHTDAFVSVAESHLDEGSALGVLGDAVQCVIRSGIDLSDFARADELRAATRAELGYSDDTPVIGMVACLKPQKAPLDFVELAAQVHARHPEARFFIAGDGELRGAVEQRVRERGLDDVLRLLGWRRDVPALMGALDIAVLTSLWEGLPRVCPQAMAAGRPMVATAVDGTPEAVEHGRTGLLFEPGEWSVGADQVTELIEDPSLRSRYGEAARESVWPFDQGLMVRQLEELYGLLLEA
ncbi:MAG: glycosyl transferase family 1 [Planctomycetota bacterium]|nr:MAG: glycosyl transferase family 1 [Planctomycetota bacterium]